MNYFEYQNDQTHEIRILLLILPPPLSLDLLCDITNNSPTKILNSLEELVQKKYLSRYTEKGVGYYFLTDSTDNQNRLKNIPEDILKNLTQNALKCISKSSMEDKKKCFHLAHIYHVTGFPIQHFKEVIKAGNYCLDFDLPVDATRYYKMALDGMEKRRLQQEDKPNYVDAAIGFYTCKNNALSPKIQGQYLDRALELTIQLNDYTRKVDIHILLAKIHAKTANNEEAVRHIDIAWQMLSEYEFSPDVKLRITLANSEVLFWRGEIKKAIERYESVIGSLEKLPSDIETLKSCLRLGLAYNIAGEAGRGLGLIAAIHKKAIDIAAKDLEHNSMLFNILALAIVGRIGEAESFFNKIFESPEFLLDPYLQWAGNAARSYLAYCRGNLDDTFNYLDLALKSGKTMGIEHYHGHCIPEIMLGLEEAGMSHPEWTFERDINRLISWPDIYMQGVAFRFRALKAFKQNKPATKIKDDLDTSISLLTKAGAKIELARSLILMARVSIAEGKTNEVGKILKDAWVIFSKANPKLFPNDLKIYLDHSAKNALWVEALLEIGNALSAKMTREEMLGKIISQAMRITGAERGAIFLQQNDLLEMVASRNLSFSEIDDSEFKPLMTVMNEVCQIKTEIIKQFEVHQEDQVKGLNLGRWTVCFPIQLKNKVLGVIFMDSGLHQIAPPKDEISILRIISNQAAVALDNMDTYDEIIDRNSELQAETHFYRERFEHNPVKSQMVGQSDQFYKMLSLIDQVADSDTTIMITGETGVGKDMVARAIHQHSNRSSEPFIAVNFLSLSPDVIASELFGHEKGAFTGALHTHKGRFELASKGTLFLDDIDALPQDIQVKLLRILETKEFERVGGTETLKTSFRLLASSNRELEHLVAKGLFRSDFYYRLNVFPIKVPALRERRDDIPILAQHFTEMFSKKFGKKAAKISRKDLEMLMNYPWPGNIRELRHVIERAILVSNNSYLVFPPLNALTTASQVAAKPLTYNEMEIRHIREALAYCHGKVSGKSGAAELLQLNPATLYSKMKRFGIEKETHFYKKDN